MEIRNVKLSKLIHYEKNTKKHDDVQINNVAESIRKFGFVQPIVVDKDNVIVIGHCRALAAQRLNLAEVPCILVDNLTPAQVDALRVVDNKTNESPWDIDLLADVLPELDLADFDFDWDIESADDYETDFTLPDGYKDEFCQMTFTLHERQKELIEYALGVVADDISETFGNENKNGNALYEVIRQWAEQRS